MTALPPKGDADKKIGAYTAPLSVSPQDTPNMTVKIRAGAWFNGAGNFVEYAGGSSPTVTAPVGNPKWVVVALLDAGSIALLNGTPAATPTLPAVPAGALPLAALYVTPTTTAITASLMADVRPFLRTIDMVPNLTAELANRPTFTDQSNALALKADVDGTPDTTFTMNADFITGAPGADVSFAVSRGAAPTVAIRWNESVDLWELTNDGVTYNPVATATGTFAPLVHTHVAADVTNFSSAVNALIALATIAQSQVTNLVTDLAAKASTSALTTHTGNAAIHFTLPIAQSDVTGLAAALSGKANISGDTFTNTVTVQNVGNQPISLVSVDSGSSGLLVDRTGVPGPNALLEWDESSDAWMVGTIGSMNTVLTGAAVAGKVDTTTQVIAGTGLSGGGALTGNVTLSLNLPSVGTPISDALRKITTDAQGRVSGSSAVVAGDLTPILDATYVNVSGDSMTGALNMGGNALNQLVQLNGNNGNSMAITAGTNPGSSGNELFLRGGVAANGTGGGVLISGRDGVGTDQSGGWVSIQAGDKTGVGAAGKIALLFPATGTLQVNGSDGTSGQVLTSNGASAPPSWAAVTLPNTGTAGTYDRVTTDAQGRVTSGVTQFLKGSQTFTFGAIAANDTGNSTNTVTIVGAQGDDVVSISAPAFAFPAGFTYQAWVSATDTVSVRAHGSASSGTGAGAADLFANIVVTRVANV